MVKNRRTSAQKMQTFVQQTAYQLVLTIVLDRPDHPKCLYTQQLAIFKPRLSYFRLLKAQLNRFCLNLMCYILWKASNKKCTERFEPLYKKVVPLFNDANNGTRYRTFCTGTRTAVRQVYTKVHLEWRKYMSRLRGTFT